MGQRAQRMCGKCYQLAERGSTLCAKHKAAPDIRQRSPLTPRYKCKRWYMTRRLVLARDVQCTEKTNGVQCLQLATDVHHVIDAQTWVAQGGDFYDQDNLAGLCKAHHTRYTSREIHGM